MHVQFRFADLPQHASVVKLNYCKSKLPSHEMEFVVIYKVVYN